MRVPAMRGIFKHRHARPCATGVWHGLCLSCRLLHGGINTNIAAPLRRTGCVWSEVKSGLLWLGGGGSLEKLRDRAPVHQVFLPNPFESAPARPHPFCALSPPPQHADAR